MNALHLHHWPEQHDFRPRFHTNVLFDFLHESLTVEDTFFSYRNCSAVSGGLG